MFAFDFLSCHKFSPCQKKSLLLQELFPGTRIAYSYKKIAILLEFSPVATISFYHKNFPWPRICYLSRICKQQTILCVTSKNVLKDNNSLKDKDSLLSAYSAGLCFARFGFHVKSKFLWQKENSPGKRNFCW